MANPRDLERVFVVRDFATEGLEQALQNLIRRPGRDYELRAPGVVGEGGEILRDVVLPGIMAGSWCSSTGRTRTSASRLV